MHPILSLASRGNSDPSVSIYLGLGAILVLGIGIYALVKYSLKHGDRMRDAWQEAADDLEYAVVPPSALGMQLMKGTFNGRDVSVAHRMVATTRRSEGRFLFCQVDFVRPLQSSTSIEPMPMNFWLALGGNETHIPSFDDHFKTYAEDLGYLKALLMAKPETMDGRVLADDFLNRLRHKSQRVCLSQTTLELAVRAEDISEGLSELIKEHVKETIELADLIERRARSIENNFTRVDEPEPSADPSAA